jgi:hypothetical protein
MLPAPASCRVYGCVVLTTWMWLDDVLVMHSSGTSVGLAPPCLFHALFVTISVCYVFCGSGLVILCWSGLCWTCRGECYDHMVFEKKMRERLT